MCTLTLICTRARPTELAYFRLIYFCPSTNLSVSISASALLNITVPCWPVSLLLRTLSPKCQYAPNKLKISCWYRGKKLNLGPRRSTFGFDQCSICTLDSWTCLLLTKKPLPAIDQPCHAIGFSKKLLINKSCPPPIVNHKLFQLVRTLVHKFNYSFKYTACQP